MCNDIAKRCWNRFSVRTLITVTAVLLVGVGLVSYRMRQARSNRERIAASEELIARFKRLGGDVSEIRGTQRPATWLEKQFDDPGTREDPVVVVGILGINLNNTTVTDADLECLPRMNNPHFHDLFLEGTQVTDAAMDYIKELDSLQRLALGGTSVSDTGLKSLTDAGNLKWLRLTNANITNAGLANLAGSNVESLDLEGTRITDDGLAQLEAMKSLRLLGLGNTNITDAGIKHLKKLEQLMYLELWGTNISVEDIEELRQALPDCNIQQTDVPNLP